MHRHGVIEEDVEDAVASASQVRRRELSGQPVGLCCGCSRCVVPTGLAVLVLARAAVAADRAQHHQPALHVRQVLRTKKERVETKGKQGESKMRKKRRE